MNQKNNPRQVRPRAHLRHPHRCEFCAHLHIHIDEPHWCEIIEEYLEPLFIKRLALAGCASYLEKQKPK